MVFRRFVAFVLLVIVAAFQAESVRGAMRDGEVHHESRAAALAHDGLGGHDGHEDTHLPDHAPGSGHSHDGQHQHGGSGDHCTHQHLAGLASPVQLAFFGTLSLQSVEPPAAHVDRIPRTLLRPPRA